jgi:molybdopterin molybdotransferase
MISVSEAEKIVLGAAKLLPVENVPLKKAYGRILREDLKSDREQPPFDKVTMDGIDFSYEAWQKGTRLFTIEKVVAAGDAPYKLQDKNCCVQIMTGAVLPQGCDCVIAIEQVDVDESTAQLKQWTLVSPRQNIRYKAADQKKGQVVLDSGSILLSPQIGVAASIGRTSLKVTKRPKIAIIATGNELVDIGKPIKAHQTRLSNSYALQSLFENSGLADAEIFHLPDNKKILMTKIKALISAYDIVVSSGGVSMGEFDYLPQVLKALGVKPLFHKVTQKPGKPFWFGKTKSGKPVFALPGNPVSTIMCAYRYAIPYLQKASGLNVVTKHVVLKESFDPKTDLTYFAPVTIKEKDGVLLASVIDIGGSGDFTALADADGFIQYEHNIKKTAWPYFSWRS